jgi:hypothetical protein
MIPTYDKAYFIAKFEAIPEEKWTTRMYISRNDQRCAVGHCLLDWMKMTEESRKLEDYLPDVLHINDGEDWRYPQPTPKQRILAALRDLP